MADLLGMFEQAVLLAVTNLRSEAYGRAILRTVQELLVRETPAGAVYTTLDRLEEKAMLSSRLDGGDSSRGGRARRYYKVTAKGAAALNESKAALEAMWRGTRWPIKQGI